jgi:hypothetical protein
MHARWFLFAALVLLHAAAATGFFSSEALAPVVAGSIYLPLIPLEAVGIPVFAPAESGGWAAPSLLGWGMVVSLWPALWLVMATFLSRLFTKRGGRA